MQAFKINNAFTIVPDSNLVTTEAKLEPRLMRLLLLLVENKGKLVSREEIIEKIWDNYGGGDDGLTQAVSFLRKILNDTDKKIIETVPKGGYIFNGEVELIKPVAAAENEQAKPKRTISIKAAVIAAILLVAMFSVIIYRISQVNNYAPKPEHSLENVVPENAPAPK